MFALSALTLSQPRTSSAKTLAPLTKIAQVRALWRSRRALAKLTPAQLDDIGVSATQAAAEAGRPPWDAPAHWQR